MTGSRTKSTMRLDCLCPDRCPIPLFTSCITRDIDYRDPSTYPFARRKLSRASVHIDTGTVCDDKVLADLASPKRINQPFQSIVCALAGFPEARQFAGIPCERLVSSCCPLRLHNDPCLPSQAQRGIWTVYTCLHNNRSSTHNRVITDAGASFDDASVANIDVLAYAHFASGPCTLASIQWPRINRLFQSRDGHASTNPRVPSYHNPARVKHLTVRPNDSIVANREVIAIVAVKWRGHNDTTTQTTGDLPLTDARVDPPSRNNSFKEPSAIRGKARLSCIEAKQCLRADIALANKLCRV